VPITTPIAMTEAAGTPGSVAPVGYCYGCARSRREIVHTAQGEITYCALCMTTCIECATSIPRSEANPVVGGGYVCRDCRHTFLECYSCGLYVSEGEHYTVENARTRDLIDICRECFANSTYRCPDCEGTFLGRRCPDCSGDVLPYDFRPCFKPRLASGEMEARYYLGFEVEVEGGQSVPHGMPQWVYCKSDGSLNDGFEVVSQPLSPKWIREHHDEVTTMLATLRNHSFESYDTDTCGMHVHVSRTAFDGTFHLLKFLELFYRWPSWTLIISQREEENLQHWANTGASMEDVYRKAKIKANAHEDRYTAVNLENDATFEVRVFRGTLSNVAFLKNLQYVEAAVEFTRDASRKKVTPREFRRWVVTKRKLYPELIAWLSEGGHLEREGRNPEYVRSDSRNG
jgi:hypothetical protein